MSETSPSFASSPQNPSLHQGVVSHSPAPITIPHQQHQPQQAQQHQVPFKEENKLHEIPPANVGLENVNIHIQPSAQDSDSHNLSSSVVIGSGKGSSSSSNDSKAHITRQHQQEEFRKMIVFYGSQTQCIATDILHRGQGLTGLVYFCGILSMFAMFFYIPYTDFCSGTTTFVRDKWWVYINVLSQIGLSIGITNLTDTDKFNREAEMREGWFVHRKMAFQKIEPRSFLPWIVISAICIVFSVVGIYQLSYNSLYFASVSFQVCVLAFSDGRQRRKIAERFYADNKREVAIYTVVPLRYLEELAIRHPWLKCLLL